MREIIMVTGAPGTGKSTWIADQIETSGSSRVAAVHRDDVRLQLRIEKDTQDYFPVSEQDELFRFVQEINKVIGDPTISTIYIDATFINKNSRRKLLSLLDLKDFTLTVVNFVMAPEIALERNASRKGYERVPPSVVKRMLVQYEPATVEEIQELSNAGAVHVITLEHNPE